MKLSGTASRIVAACVLMCTSALAGAQQDYPVKPIPLLIPFPPGTGNDVVGRIVGNKLTEYLGQRVVADNRAGASGNIAIDLARRAAPDGYTLVVTAGVVDLLAERTHMMFAPMVTSLSHYRAGSNCTASRARSARR